MKCLSCSARRISNLLNFLTHLYRIVARTQTRKIPTSIERASNHGGSRERKCVRKLDTSIFVLKKYDTKSDLSDGKCDWILVTLTFEEIWNKKCIRAKEHSWHCRPFYLRGASSRDNEIETSWIRIVLNIVKLECRYFFQKPVWPMISIWFGKSKLEVV